VGQRTGNSLLWLSIWLGIIGQVVLAAYTVIVQITAFRIMSSSAYHPAIPSGYQSTYFFNRLLWGIAGIALVVFGLVMARSIVKLRRSSTVSSAQFRLVSRFLALSLVFVVLPRVIVAAMYGLQVVGVTYLLIYVTCIALIWNGLRVLRANTVSGLG
jgi:hypothetical protein